MLWHNTIIGAGQEQSSWTDIAGWNEETSADLSGNLVNATYSVATLLNLIYFNTSSLARDTAEGSPGGTGPLGFFDVNPITQEKWRNRGLRNDKDGKISFSV